ncbi:MAG TPA: hypothetical protein VKP13_11045 [Nitrospira sp.]|nr:hypothetical protein [Nitrospira sp.]
MEADFPHSSTTAYVQQQPLELAKAELTGLLHAVRTQGTLENRQMKDMRILSGIAALGFLVLIATCLPVAASQAGGAQCKGSDSVSVQINDYLDSLLISDDSGNVAMRDTVGIAGVQPSQVIIITDERTCSRLASAIDHLEGVNRPGRMVYAFSVGTRFAALDLSIKAGEWVQLLFYDNHYKLLWSVGVF